MKKILIRFLAFIGVLLVDIFIFLLFNNPKMSIGIFTFISSAILIFTHPKELGWFKSYFIFLIYTNLALALFLVYHMIDSQINIDELPMYLLLYFMIPKAFHSVFLIIKYPGRLMYNVFRLIIAIIFGFTWFIVLILMMNSSYNIFYYLIVILQIIELLLMYFGNNEKTSKPKKVVIA